MRQFTLLLVTAAVFATAGQVLSQEKVRKEFPARHAPIEVIRPALEKVLSPAGRFIILPGSGNVMVVDFAENVEAAGKTLATLKIPAPQVALNFAFRTNVAPGAPGAQPVTSLGGFPFPTRYLPPRIIQNGNGFIVIPAHPTNFKKRNVGVTMDTNSTVNPDGSIDVQINTEHTEFEGFINYGSGIFTSGVPGSIPVINNVGNPGFFAPFANSGDIKVPIFQTTRISTQILVRPTTAGDRVRVDMIPQLKISNPVEPGTEAKTINLTQYRTGIDLLNGRTGKLPGFKGASVEFNRNFLGAKDGEEGGTAIMMRARIGSGTIAEPSESGTPESKAEAEAEAEAGKAGSAEGKIEKPAANP